MQDRDESRRRLFEQMFDGYALHEVILDARGRLCDYRLLEVNPAFSALTGLPAEKVIGKRVREVLPTLEPRWFAVYEQVVLTGEPARFTAYVSALDKHFEVAAYRPGAGRFVVLFRDVTERIRTEEALRAGAQRLDETLAGIIALLGRTTEIRDPYTAGHQRRVAQLARAMTTAMGLPEAQGRLTYLAALVHDIGKIAVPTEILHRPGPLSPLHYALIREHPAEGAALLRPIDPLRPVAQIIGQHHERLDGSGYPYRLRGDAIRLEARIIAVADVFESMCFHRSYRPGLSKAVAMEEIRQNRGRLYDAVAAEACLDIVQGEDFHF